MSNHRARREELINPRPFSSSFHIILTRSNNINIIINAGFGTVHNIMVNIFARHGVQNIRRNSYLKRVSLTKGRLFQLSVDYDYHYRKYSMS